MLRIRLVTLVVLVAAFTPRPARAESGDPGPDEVTPAPSPREVPAGGAGGAQEPPSRSKEGSARLLELAAQALTDEGAPAERRALVELARDRVEEALKLLGEKPASQDLPRAKALRASALIRAGESGEAAGLLREAAALLESKGSLTLRSLAFAEKILSFGVWDETKGIFKPGDRAMLYCELMGFACVKRTAEEYAVSLTFALSVEREDGSVVVRSLRDDPVEHKTRSRIHDLHLCSRFDLPKGLLPGKYVIRATVTDRSTGASASAGIPFEISEAAAPESK